MVEEATRTTTHSSNILDILFTNQPERIHELSVEDGISDHKAVISEISISHKINKAPKRKILLYHKADTDNFKRELTTNLQSFTDSSNSNNDIDSIFQSFTNILDSAVEKSLPSTVQKDSTD